MAGQSQGLFAAVDERQVVLVEHAEALAGSEFLSSFPGETGLVLVSVEALRASRGRARKSTKPGAPSDLSLPDAVQEIGGRVQRIERLAPFDVKPWIVARALLHKVTLQPDAMDAIAFALAPTRSGSRTRSRARRLRERGAGDRGRRARARERRDRVGHIRAHEVGRRRSHREAVPLLERFSPRATRRSRSSRSSSGSLRAALRVHGAVERRR